LVFLRLLFDEGERRTAFRDLRGDAFLHIQLGELPRHAECSFRLGVAVLDPENVLPDGADGCPFLDVLDKELAFPYAQPIFQPAAVFEDDIHDLASEDHLARVLTAVEGVGRYGSACHQGLDDGPFIHENAGRRRITLGPQPSPRQRHRVHNDEYRHNQSARMERLGNEGFCNLFG